ncbi:hypothetical protein BDW22DRAFT_1431889 [Trametopsis cervina]|nr:hypothetical protein BDW22DRAFT_1431889 [Trametopsis cervina]
MSSSVPLEQVLASLNVDETVGALVVGAIVTNILYGITSVQCYIYFNENRNQNDGKIFSYAILVLWVLDTLETILLAHLVYHYTVTWAFNPEILSRIVWSAPLHLLVGIIGDIIITTLFSLRIWKFGRNVWPLVLIMVPAGLSFLAFLVACIRALVNDKFANFENTSTWVWEVGYGLKVVADFAVMLSLSTILFKRRASTPVQRTNAIINRLLVFSINTCILTSSVAIAALVTFVTVPKTFWWITLTAISPKMMMNSLMAWLNSRESLRARLIQDVPLSIQLPRLDARITGLHPASAQIPGDRSSSPNGGKNMVIHVESEVVDDRSECSGQC